MSRPEHFAPPEIVIFLTDEVFFRYKKVKMNLFESFMEKQRLENTQPSIHD